MHPTAFPITKAAPRQLLEIERSESGGPTREAHEGVQTRICQFEAGPCSRCPSNKPVTDAIPRQPLEADVVIVPKANQTVSADMFTGETSHKYVRVQVRPAISNEYLHVACIR